MDKEKKKEEFFDGKSEVGTNPIVTFVHVAIVCLKKNCTQFSSQSFLIDEMLQFNVQEKLAVSTYHGYLFQVATFRTNCPNCNVPCDTNMKLVGILLNLLNCY